MNARQKQQIEMYQRVQDFVQSNQVPAGNAGTLLADVVTQLVNHGRDQRSGIRLGRHASEQRRRLLAALRTDHLRPIATVANAVLAGAPGIDAALRVPGTSVPATRLVADARAIRDAVVPYAAVFTANGRGENFLERLDGAIEALDGIVIERSRMVQLKVGATRGLEEQIRLGRKAVAMLDAIVQVHFREQATVLAAWRSTRRVQAVRGRNGDSPAAPGREEATSRAAA